MPISATCPRDPRNSDPTKDVFARRESVGLAGQIVPTAHQAGAVHVNERVGHTQVFGDELFEELPVRQSKSTLMEIVERGYRRNTIHAPAHRSDAAAGAPRRPFRPLAHRLWRLPG